jgi:hypothetical protein
MPTYAACALRPESWMAIFAPTAPELGLTEIWSVPVELLPVETPAVPLEEGVPVVVRLVTPGVPVFEAVVVDAVEPEVVLVDVGAAVEVGLVDVAAAVEALPLDPPLLPPPHPARPIVSTADETATRDRFMC